MDLCTAHGINLITIFEDEWLFDEPMVTDRLKAILNDAPLDIMKFYDEITGAYTFDRRWYVRSAIARTGLTWQRSTNPVGYYFDANRVRHLSVENLEEWNSIYDCGTDVFT